MAITAPGFEPKVVAVTLERGKTATIDAKLEAAGGEKPAEPMPDPAGNNTAPPPATLTATGPLGEIMTKLRATHQISSLAGMKPVKIYGSGFAAIGGNIIKHENIFGVFSPIDGRFRVEYIERSDSSGRKIVAGFDGKTLWKTANGRPETVKPDDRFFENPMGALFYALTAPTVTLSERFSKPKDAKPYLSASDPVLGDFKIVFDPKSFQVTEISLKREVRPVFKYANYKPVEGVLFPFSIIGDGVVGAVTYNYSRIEPNAPFGGSYFSGR